MPKYAQPDLNFIGNVFFKFKTILLLLYSILLTLSFFLKKCLNIIKEYVLPILAPEIQHKSECGIASDMFSLGMVMIAAFNGGQSVIQANHSTNLYFKQAGVVSRTCG